MMTLSILTLCCLASAAQPTTFASPAAPRPGVQPTAFSTNLADHEVRTTPDPGRATWAPDEEFKKRLEAAGKDLEALWKLHAWCTDTERAKDGRSVVRRILKLDKENKKAHELSGHIFYDDQWFTTEKKVAAYKKKAFEREAKDKGWVRYKGSWADPADIPFLEEGMVKTANGTWLTAEDKKRLDAGWVHQDLEWVEPDEIPKMEEGLWKCDKRWLRIEEANDFHAHIGTWWQIPGDGTVLWTTVNRQIAEKAKEAMTRGMDDVKRIYGRVPSSPVNVMLLRNTEQYSTFAVGDDMGLPQTETRGYSSIYHAFFAEQWFDERDKLYLGMGAGYWDSSVENGNTFGPYSARAAFGFSIANGLDPSTKAVKRLFKGGGPGDDWSDTFWEEKRLPRWFHFGAAIYIERYFIDGLVDSGGDPTWVRKWSLDNLKRRGGLETLNQVFRMSLNADSEEDSKTSGTRLLEAGLLMAFILDGDCEEVKKCHAAVIEAFRGEGSVARECAALRSAIEEHEQDLRTFAGI